MKLPHLTSCGLPGIDLAPFGMHACHFYRDRDELVATLIPYFVAGLEGNERCLWVAAAPLPASEAAQALRAAWEGADAALDAGALRIVDHDQWYGGAAPLEAAEVVQLWLDEEARALSDGYRGLRITGNISFLRPDAWPEFIAYEHAVTTGLADRRIVALCSYPLPQCDGDQVRHVEEAHHCAFERVGAEWQVAPAPVRGSAQTVRHEIEEPAMIAAPRDTRPTHAGAPASEIPASSALALYTFDCRRADGSPICLEAYELSSDAAALARAGRLLAEHLTCSTVEVFEAERFVGAIARSRQQDDPSASPAGSRASKAQDRGRVAMVESARDTGS